MLFTNSSTFAVTQNLLHEYLKSEEQIQVEAMQQRREREQYINYVRGSADFTWSVYQEVLQGRKEAFKNLIEITPAMELEIEKKLVQRYKDRGYARLINDYENRVNEDKYFRGEVFDYANDVIGSALGKKQAELKQDFQGATSEYYWETILKPDWDSVSVREDFIIVKSNSKFGLKGINGKTVLDTKFDKIYITGKNTALGQRKKNNTTNEFVGTDGKVAFTLPSNYKIDNFYRGQAVVYIQGYIDSSRRQHLSKAGVIDAKGKFIVPMNYYSISGILKSDNTYLYHAVKLDGNLFKSSLINTIAFMSTNSASPQNKGST